MQSNFEMIFLESCLFLGPGYVSLHSLGLPRKKNATFEWTQDLQDKLEEIKAHCKSLPRLALPLEQDNLIIETDASEEYRGAVLKKQISEQVCRHTSGTFSDTEKRYHSNEKELLALKKGIKKFSYFLLHKKFIARTDNTQVKAFVKNKLPNTPEYKRLNRWQTFFEECQFHIEIIKGKTNVIADFLS